MTGQKRFFRDLQEGGTGIHIELCDDARYRAQGVGTVSFERESRKPLSFFDVVYVRTDQEPYISLHFGGQGILGDFL